MTSGCSSDLRKATSVATQMVRNYGYSEKLGPVWLGRDDPISPKNREEVENEVRSYVLFTLSFSFDYTDASIFF